MAEQMDELDDARYQHHLQHRGRANHRIFWAVWTLIGVYIVAHGVYRATSWWDRRSRHKHQALRPRRSPVRLGILRQSLAIIKAFSSLPLPRLLSSILPTLSFGRLALLVSYIAITVFLLCSVDAPFSSQHYTDDLAFRAAWVTLTQIPLVYLLSAKRGILDVAALSYERINWLHRWIGRILFLCATMHVAIMKSSISTSDIIRSTEPSMSIVRYGIGAYSTLIWIAVTSMLTVRIRMYRLFYINHWISTLGLLIIVFQHVPTYARAPIYLAAGFVAVDKCLVTYQFCKNNISVRPLKRKFAKFRRGPGRGVLVAGYAVEMTTPSATIIGLPTQSKASTTIVRIAKIPICWKPGQHIRIYVPAIGAFETHPLTPANCSIMPPPPLPPRKDLEHGSLRSLSSTAPKPMNEMLLLIKSQSGFTKRLADYQSQWLTRPCPNASKPAENLVAYIDGPYGNAPNWESFETLVLITASTGISFVLAILDHLEQLCFLGAPELETHTVKLVWAMRHIEPQLEDTITNLLVKYQGMFHENGIALQVATYTTCLDSIIGNETSAHDLFAHLRHSALPKRQLNKPALKIRNPNEIYEEWDREANLEAMNSQELDAFMTNDDDAERYSFETEESSEVSTLVDGQGWCSDEEDPFSDAYVTTEHDSAYRPLPASRASSRKSMDMEEPGCQCALIQYQRRKLTAVATGSGFITRHYGMRPDVPYAIVEAVERGDAQKSMVAVCANSHVAREAQSTVGKMNIDFAMGRRRNEVDIFVEGFR